MAIWQFKAQVFPTDLLAGKDQLTESEFNDLDDQSLSETHPQATEILASFSDILPPLKSWSDDLRQWGIQDGDLIEAWFDDSILSSISFRIDCRSPHLDFIAALCAIPLRYDLSFIYLRTLAKCPVDFEGFCRFISSSANRRWMEDPKLWIPQLAKEVTDKEKGSA